MITANVWPEADRGEHPGERSLYVNVLVATEGSLCGKVPSR